MNKQMYNATVVAKPWENDHHCILDIAPKEGQIANHKAGQYALVGLQNQTPVDTGKRRVSNPRFKLTRRAYSIVSRPGLPYYRLFVTRVNDGQLSPGIHSLNVGDDLWLSKHTQGKMTPESQLKDKHVLMMATGTGIAPFLSIIAQQIATPTWASCTLLLGCRTQQDIYPYDLNQWQETASFHYLPSLTKPDESWTGLRGRIDRFLDAEKLQQLHIPLDPEQTHVMLCGNPAMVDHAEQFFIPLGWQRPRFQTPGSLWLERYW